MSGSGTSVGTKVLFVVLGMIGVGLVASAGVFGLEAFDKLRSRRLDAAVKAFASAERAAQDTKTERDKRTRAVVTVAPAPLPNALPLIERPGTDDYGYPRSYVDEPGLRSLLHFGHYEELSRYVEQLEQSFEDDPKKEMWPVQAFDAFDSAEPELTPKLEAWVNAMPLSFASHLALGAHWVAITSARRGGKVASQTAQEDFQSMREAAKVAHFQLQQAIVDRPRAVVARSFMARVALFESDRQLSQDNIDAALKTCPTCFSVRVVYMNRLKPRWGGSYEAMRAFFQAAPVAKNPKLSLLPGYIDVDRSDLADSDKRLDDALGFAEAACKLGKLADFLEQRAEIFREKKDLQKAKADLDAALELRPERSSVRAARAEVLAQLKDYEPAALDLLQVMRVHPTELNTDWTANAAAWGLDQEGWAAHQKGDHERALRLLDLALELKPFDTNLRRHHEEAVRGGLTGTPEEIAALQAKVKANPDSFAAHQQLDYLYARSRNFGPVIELWTAYLARHPDDGNALFERGGAYYNSGHRAEALQDDTRACELGVNAACAHLQKMNPAAPGQPSPNQRQ